MSTENDELNKELITIQNQMEDYESTIRAGQSFISLVTWEKENSTRIMNSHFSCGRKMNTSGSNLISKNCEVTPDVVIQRLPDLGYIVEIKKSLPREKKEWDEVAKQIIKYADKLIGWWNPPNELIQTQCVVLLIHMSRGKDFSEYFKNFLQKNRIELEIDISIIEFSRSDERVNNYFLRTQFGEIKDVEINKRLLSGVTIPTEPVVASYGKQKFTDSEPPFPEYTMSILWQDIFNSKPRRTLDPKSKVYLFEINVQDLTFELQKLYGSEGNSYRDVEFPQVSWIKSALDAFVEIKYAEKIDNENYRIFFKFIRDPDLISHFVKRKKKQPKVKKESVNQPTLFDM